MSKASFNTFYKGVILKDPNLLKELQGVHNADSFMKAVLPAAEKAKAKFTAGDVAEWAASKELLAKKLMREECLGSFWQIYTLMMLSQATAYVAANPEAWQMRSGIFDDRPKMACYLAQLTGDCCKDHKDIAVIKLRNIVVAVE